MVGAGVMDLHPERLPGLAGSRLPGWQDLGVGCSWGLGRESCTYPQSSPPRKLSECIFRALPAPKGPGTEDSSSTSSWLCYLQQVIHLAEF